MRDPQSSRRTFLRGVGVTMALPWLESVPVWGAEPMGVLERDWIGAALGVHPDPIYQATEGFLGAACPEGVLQ